MTGKDIASDVKLIVRADNGEQLTGEEKFRASVMAAYIKGIADGLHPIQVLYPVGPIYIPESTTIGQLAKAFDGYMDKYPASRDDPTALIVYNFAAEVYKNPNYNPALMPRVITLPPNSLKPVKP